MSPLSEYNAKRNFDKTKEPRGSAARKAGKLRFVVQRHHASRLHYDFRLEMGGVLKSWAVPKGPSLNPQDKRLAVMVEDHPLRYRTFEGEIPKGNYGFGTVSIFDKGYYTALEKGDGEQELLDAWERGHIKVVLHGKKLRGEFALVRINNSNEENAWLLIKHNDRYAVQEEYHAEDKVSLKVKEEGELFRAQESEKKGKGKTAKRKGDGRKESPPKDAMASNDVFSPMLAVLSTGVSDDTDWIFEKKLDGFRALVEVTKKDVQIHSRNGVHFNKQFPSLAESLKAVDRTLILDGEIVAEDSKARSHFQLLQHGEPLPAKFKLRYYVFDLLMLDGNDLREFPFSARRDLLQRWFAKFAQPEIRLVPQLDGPAEKALQQAKRAGWEGIMAKQADSRYLAAKRSTFWRKLKVQQSQEAIIVGFTAPSGSRIGFGALVLAVFDDAGSLRHIGNVGTGFHDDQLADLMQKLKKIVRQKKPLSSEIKVANEKHVTWVKPALIAEIAYAEWTTDGHLRHPVFKALRTDKKMEEIKKVTPLEEMTNDREVRFGKKILQLSNQKKLYWPKENVRKGDLLAYYEQVGQLMLPYLKDKPISMNRFPNGIEQPGFFQKDVDKNTGPRWLKTVELESESTGNTVNYLLCNDLPTLLWVANMGSIEINPWLATYRKKNNPVFGVLDIDPNGVDFKTVVSVANTAHDILMDVGVRSYVKTSGSTGLHIYIYLAQKYTFEVVRDFIQMLAELLHEEHAQVTSLERSPIKRKKKIYLDYMQNKRAQTIVAPYSVRPKAFATVSTPLDWSEVNEDLSIQQFTMASVLARVAAREDPWATIFDEPADLKKAIAAF
ncbi:DNA ligase D [Sphingobacterium griseoflavum]|nr:DNA ligase D [Sphingobacterium griseoflavum]